MKIETMVNGKHRDFLVDAKGTVTEVEDETAIDRKLTADHFGFCPGVDASD